MTDRCRNTVADDLRINFQDTTGSIRSQEHIVSKVPPTSDSACSSAGVTVPGIDIHQPSQSEPVIFGDCHRYVTFLEVYFSARGHELSSLPRCCLETKFGAPTVRHEFYVTRDACQPRIFLCWRSLCRRWHRQWSTYLQRSNVCREIESRCHMSKTISIGLHPWPGTNRSG